MKAYSIDLRQRVLADGDAGRPTKPVAEKDSVRPAIVRRWKQRRRENGELEPRRCGGHRPRQVDRDAVATAVRKQPDTTLRELRDALRLECGHYLRHCGYRYSKK